MRKYIVLAAVVAAAIFVAYHPAHATVCLTQCDAFGNCITTCQ